MKNIPDNIKLTILSFLREKQSLGRVAQVSKAWNILAKQDVLWSPFLHTNKLIQEAKEIYKNIDTVSKMNILYYACTSESVTRSRFYQIPNDFQLNEASQNHFNLQFFTPGVIGIGYLIGPHADIIKLLNVADCIVLYIPESHCHRFSKHLNKLLNISHFKGHDVPWMKMPVLKNGFPKIPIIAITEPNCAEIIRKQATSHHIQLDKIITKTLLRSTWHELDAPNLGNKEATHTWLELTETIMQAVSHQKQNAVKHRFRKRIK